MDGNLQRRSILGMHIDFNTYPGITRCHFRMDACARVSRVLRSPAEIG